MAVLLSSGRKGTRGMSPAHRIASGLGGSKLRDAGNAIPPTGLLLMSITSTQLGAAIAKNLFDALSPAGTVLLRIGFAALFLLLLWRPKLTAHSKSAYFTALLFGISLAAMNLCYYLALDRLPMGIAVTLEFVGPLGVAVAGSRRLLDLLWVALAASGILMLNPLAGTGLDGVGVGLGLLAGCFWAAYIILSARVGRSFPGGTGLALAMCVAAVAVAPVGIANGGGALLDPRLLAVGAGVALLSSAIPYSLELEALRRLPTRIFGVLMSLEPALAALVGFVILHERLGIRAIAAVGLVTAAALGASRFSASGK